MFRIDVRIDGEAYDVIKRMAKEVGLKLDTEKCIYTKGMTSETIVTGKIIQSNTELSESATIEIVDFIIRYHTVVVDSYKAIYHAVRGFISLSNLMDRDFRTLKKKYFNRDDKSIC